MKNEREAKRSVKHRRRPQGGGPKSPHYQALNRNKSGTIEISADRSSRPEQHLQTPSGYINGLISLVAEQCGLSLKIKADYPAEDSLQPFVHDMGGALGEAVCQTLTSSWPESETFSGSWMEEDAAAFALCRPGTFSFTLTAEKLMDDLFIRKDLPFQLIEEFLYSFARSVNISVYVKLLHGNNAHRCGMALTGAVAVCLRQIRQG